MIPRTVSTKGCYIAGGEWDLRGFSDGAETPAAKRIRMVAGACFEAIHNALGAWLVRRWLLPKNGRRPVRP